MLYTKKELMQKVSSRCDIRWHLNHHTEASKSDLGHHAGIGAEQARAPATCPFNNYCLCTLHIAPQKKASKKFQDGVITLLDDNTAILYDQVRCWRGLMLMHKACEPASPSLNPLLMPLTHMATAPPLYNVALVLRSCLQDSKVVSKGRYKRFGGTEDGTFEMGTFHVEIDKPLTLEQFKWVSGGRGQGPVGPRAAWQGVKATPPSCALCSK